MNARQLINKMQESDNFSRALHAAVEAANQKIQDCIDWMNAWKSDHPVRTVGDIVDALKEYRKLVSDPAIATDYCRHEFTWEGDIIRVTITVVQGRTTSRGKSSKTIYNLNGRKISINDLKARYAS